MKFVDDQIGKYKKRSKKKSIKRSNHKHTYKRCILHIEKDDSYWLSSYCTICGKLKDIEWHIEKNEEDGLSTIILDKELYRKYKDIYEVKEVKTYEDKYVKLEDR